MLSFNELYITEDGKNLVIDVSVGSDPMYKDVYIESIKLDLCSNLVNGSDVSSKAVTVYEAELIRFGDVNLDGDVGINDRQHAVDMIDAIHNGKEFLVDDYRYGAAFGLRYGDEITTNELERVLMAIDDVVGGGPIQYIPVKKRHVRICLDKNDEALVRLGVEDLSSALFMVRADAAGGDAEAIANAGCGWDTSPIFGVAYNGKPLYDSAIRYASSYGNTCNDNDAAVLEDFILRYYSFLLALKCGDVKQACYYYNTYLTGAGLGSSSSGKNCGCHGTY